MSDNKAYNNQTINLGVYTKEIFGSGQTSDIYQIPTLGKLFFHSDLNSEPFHDYELEQKHKDEKQEERRKAIYNFFHDENNILRLPHKIKIHFINNE